MYFLKNGAQIGAYSQRVIVSLFNENEHFNFYYLGVSVIFVTFH